MTRQFKKNVIKAEDIDPSKVYMTGKLPCRVKCETAPGWKRGKVSILQEGNRFFAWVRYFDGDGKEGLVELYSTDTDFYFCDVNGHANLFPIQESWILSQRAMIDNARANLKKIEQTLDQIQAIQS